MTQWGILGCAAIARHHVIPAIQHSDNHVAAIASRDAARAEQFAHQMGIDTTYGDYDALLADPLVEAVYIPLPNALHTDWARKSLRAGKHVLLEKPAVPTLADAEELALLAHQHDLVLAEAFMYRWHPQWSLLRQHLADELGEDQPATLRAHIGMALGTDAGHRQSAALHGGVFRDLGCYAIDVATWLFGAAETAALHQFYDTHEVDQLSTGWLAFPHGRLAVFDCDFRHEWVNTTLEIRTPALTLIAEHAFNPLDYPTQVRVLRPGKAEDTLDIEGVNAHHDMIRDVSDHCRHGAGSLWARDRREALIATAANTELLEHTATRTP